MGIGAMRHYVMLQKPVPVDQTTGEPSNLWQSVKHLYVSMKGGGVEQSGPGQHEARLSWVMQAHADPEIQPNRRLVMGNRIFDIVSAATLGRNVDVFVEIVASERVQ